MLVCTLCCAWALFGCTRAQNGRAASATPAQRPATPAPVDTRMPARVSGYPDNFDTLYTRLIEREISVFEIQQDVTDGLYSYEDLTRFYLDRIEEYGASNSILCTLSGARARAAACDRSPGNGSPLYGIPFIVLDNIDVAGAPTTGGAYLLRARTPEADAFLIRMLTVQGAIPLAKANLDELSGLVIQYSEKVPHGSSLGGIPVSPYGGRHDAGGASFGAAMSVTRGLAPLAVGTDTVGDVLQSARANSVVGIRPTHALVSRTGLIPANPAFDVAVPFAKSVKEAAYLLYAMQGSDMNDAYQQTGDYAPINDPEEFLNATAASALEGLRVLLFDGEDELPEAALNALVHAGAQLVGGLTYDPYAEDAAMEKLSGMPYIYGVRDSVNAFLAKQAVEGVNSITQLLRYNERHEDAIPYGQGRLNAFALLAPMHYTSVDTVDRYISEHSLEQFMVENEIDLILSRDAALAAYSNTPLNPSVSIPLGGTRTNGDGSLQSAVLTARVGGDELAIRAAYLLESSLGGLRVKP